MKLILASASPRRKELLEYLGYEFTVKVPSVNENTRPAELPEDYVSRVSKDKCMAVYQEYSDHVVLGGDTSVVLGSKILGKPGDKDQAREMMRDLSGKSHQVLSAFCIMAPVLPCAISRVVSTEVRFRELGDDEIEAYIETPEPYDKAGGYAIQGIAAKFIPEIRGSVTNVVGLALCEVDEELKKVMSAPL